VCGIVGFNWQDSEHLEKMMETLRDRGPDGEGKYLDEFVSLGHRRLAIIDLSPAGHQPMSNEDETLWLTYNGEIYNYVELVEELKKKGHQFRSKTDSEVILHAYEEWGRECVSRFNGMFAFCIYDRNQMQFFLARDRFGVKPLYYHLQNGRFTFASEIKAILEDPTIPRRPNEPLIYDYLVYNCYDHTQETFFQGINALLPGHSLVFDLREQRTEHYRWYDIPLRPFDQGASEKEILTHFRELLIDAIRLRLRSDVEVGSCLSGGLDSSSIVCSLNQFTPEHSLRFRTFSVVFPHNTEIDESGYIEKVVSLVNVSPHFVTPTCSDLLQDIRSLVYCQEEPFAGTNIYAQWKVMKLSKEKSVKVLLDGQGGDELLAGYPFFFGYYFLQLFLGLNWKTLWRELIHYRKYHRDVNEGLLTPFFLLTPSRLKPYIIRFYSQYILDKAFFKKYYGQTAVPDQMYSSMDLNQALYYRMKYGLPQLLREEDRNSMAFSIESRLPFLDYRVVEFLFSIPERFKIRDGMTKYILRESMRGILPEEVRERVGKLGFPTPMDDWIREPEMSKYIQGIFSSDRFRGRGYHDTAEVDRVFKAHIDQKANAGMAIWKMLNLELWSRIFIEEDEPFHPTCHKEKGSMNLSLETKW
jgi:asparagine synthase (glutamine-hydrolysing)